MDNGNMFMICGDTYARLTEYQLDSLKNTKLKINKDKIYFENISFIDSCSFSKSNIKVTNLFDKENTWEYSWYEDGERLLLRPKDIGPLAYRYTKKELSKIKKIDLGCKYNSLSILYLKQDTLIIDDLEGVTLFMTKVPRSKEGYTEKYKNKAL